MHQVALIILWKCKLVKHRGTPTINNEIPRKKNIKLKMQIHKMSLDKGIGNLNLDREFH
jgi:hypothetical protein